MLAVAVVYHDVYQWMIQEIKQHLNVYMLDIEKPDSKYMDSKIQCPFRSRCIGLVMKIGAFIIAGYIHNLWAKHVMSTPLFPTDLLPILSGYYQSDNVYLLYEPAQKQYQFSVQLLFENLKCADKCYCDY
eukprot:250615_1